jgi:hypothetical protein
LFTTIITTRCHTGSGTKSPASKITLTNVSTYQDVAEEKRSARMAILMTISSLIADCADIRHRTSSPTTCDNASNTNGEGGTVAAVC